ILARCKVTSVDEWMTIINEADLWQMDNLREHAISQLRQLYIEPVYKILTFSQYNTPPDELVPSYIDAITRPAYCLLERPI
ncbi:hypothetical protein BD414DRAFT_400494, partial [Trametes punicea]